MKEKEDQASQDQLLEIYRIQTQAADNSSTRRASMTRYYIIVMSALIVGFSTFVRELGKNTGGFLTDNRC